MVSRRALADTSLFIGLEQHRLAPAMVPTEIGVSVVTVGELKLGVLAATSTDVRVRRLRTLSDALALAPLPIDDEVADSWAALRVELRTRGRRMPINDSWIAATAIAHGLPVATQDDDYDDVPGLVVVRL